ncbi:hypothetical protein [Lutispora thermophila]|uniref:Uncharacterized protein n=1 Tax=Lutispora thermophila DSM 19022 TaxID=1122184 RepID=A0A1M6FGR2_9FIRM|nr:hypothetical protein [Lutispora thermophila]SHI96833.1 hypothetical protein SAMN02745176_01952 [Lutispora thermophila DSM 19022]
MGKNRKLINLMTTVLILSFIFSIGSVNLAEAPSEDKKPFPKEERITKSLEQLVEKGVLKPEDVEKINNYLKIEREEKRKMFEQMKNMTEEQRKEFIRNYRKDKVDLWEKMVDDKIITKEQADEIRKLLPHHRHEGCKRKQQ